MLKKLFSNYYFIGTVLFAFCLAVQLFWLAAFFPGAMTGDSISMWKQSIVGSGYQNLQPYLYTLYLYHLRQIWDSPALIAGIQVATSAALVSGFSVYLLRKEANKWLVVAGYLAFVFSIPIMITNTIIHRDSFYAGLILLLSIIIVSLFFRKNVDLSNTRIVLLGLLLVLIASTRYDGAIYLILIPLLLYVFKLTTRKGALLVLLTALLGYFVVQVPLANLLGIKENRYLQVYNLETKFIGAIYHDQPAAFSENDIELMTKITPIETWEKYDPTDDFLYWETYKNSNFSFADYRKNWDSMFLAKVRTYPASIVKDRYYMTLGLIRGEKINGPGIVENKIKMKQLPLTTRKTRGQLGRLFNNSYQNHISRFFVWSPLYLIVHIGFLAAAIIRKKHYLVAYITISLVSFLIIIPVVTSGQFRYMYPLYYTSFFIPALYTIKFRQT